MPGREGMLWALVCGRSSRPFYPFLQDLSVQMVS
jgi:hypothetical protein